MASRRGATDLAGILLVDKPAGMTSHDVIAVLRRATGERRIGHAGTLDPMATGLLTVLIGSATRLEQYLVGHDKRYLARIVFGAATDTLDAEGEVVETSPVPPAVTDPAFAAEVLERFLGAQDQMPPAYSAIKRDGVVAHKLARSGQAPVLEPRPITVHAASLLSIDAVQPSWDVEFAVSKGTYVRSLARDIGTAAGTCAHLGSLRRLSVGSAEVVDALTLEDAVTLAESGTLTECFVDPLTLLDMPALQADGARIRDGRSLEAAEADVEEGAAVAIVTSLELLAVYRRRGDALVADSVFSPGVRR